MYRFDPGRTDGRTTRSGRLGHRDDSFQTIPNQSEGAPSLEARGANKHHVPVGSHVMFVCFSFLLYRWGQEEFCGGRLCGGVNLMDSTWISKSSVMKIDEVWSGSAFFFICRQEMRHVLHVLTGPPSFAPVRLPKPSILPSNTIFLPTCPISSKASQNGGPGRQTTGAPVRSPGNLLALAESDSDVGGTSPRRQSRGSGLRGRRGERPGGPARRFQVMWRYVCTTLQEVSIGVCK